jgi:CRP-like cAMP-binding protein
MNSPSGEEVMSIDATAGSLLGLPGLIGDEPYSLTAVARKDAELCFISRDEFTNLMRTNPLLSLKVLQVLAAEVRSARQAILGR